MSGDRVDRLVADLVRLRPGLDAEAKALGGRLLYLSVLIQRHYRAVCDEFGVSLSGLGVLTALLRQAPKSLTLSQINQDILATSGGITFVVSSLEQKGFVTRSAHPEDGRAWLISLTGRGRRIANSLIDAVIVADEAIAAHLTADDRSRTEELLRTVQRGVEGATPRLTAPDLNGQSR